MEKINLQATSQTPKGHFVRADDFGELHGYYDDKIVLHEDENADDDELDVNGQFGTDDSDSNAEDNWRNEYPDSVSST